MNLPTCHTCKRQFREGEPGWVEDVKVIGPQKVTVERRYTCDACEVTH